MEVRYTLLIMFSLISLYPLCLCTSGIVQNTCCWYTSKTLWNIPQTGRLGKGVDPKCTKNTVFLYSFKCRFFNNIFYKMLVFSVNFFIIKKKFMLFSFTTMIFDFEIINYFTKLFCGKVNFFFMSFRKQCWRILGGGSSSPPPLI